MRYLITGGAGFIGSALAMRLVANHEVVILDDYSRGKPGRVPGCTLRQADVRDADAVAWAMQGCDAVLHLAYRQGTQTFYEEPMEVLDVALRGMQAVLDGCRRTGCGRLLLVSSSEAYQTPPSAPTDESVPLSVPDVLNPRYSYGGGKIACELMAAAWQRRGILDQVIIARPHNIYGPDMGREHVIPEFCLRMNKLTGDRPEGIISFPIQGSGEETRSFCYISDCVTQIVTLLEFAEHDQTSVWHLGHMDEHPIAEVATEVARCYGREIKIVPGKLPQGSPVRRLPDTRKVEHYAGPPQVSFAAGLAQTVSWYRDNG